MIFYRGSLNKFVQFLGNRSDEPIGEITKQDVVAFRNSLIKQSVCITDVTGNRSVIDDASSSGFNHNASLMLHGVKETLDIDVYDSINIFGCRFRQRPKLTFDPGIIKSDIDPLKLAKSSLNGLVDVLFASDVTGHKEAAPSGLFNQINNCEAELLSSPDRHDISTLSRKSLGGLLCRCPMYRQK
jgi:hypothetical protein